MPLYKIQGEKVSKLETSEPLEKRVQNLFEANLKEILGVSFLYTEFPTTWGGRIDSLGVDQAGSPVIIEYKRNTNDNVINQGLSYLKWLLDHKAEFERLVEKNSETATITLDWESPRVICIAQSFNKFDLDTVDLLPINIELIKYRIYGDFLYVESEVYPKVRIQTSGIIKKNQAKKDVPTLQKNYSIEDHLAKADDETKALFFALREKISSLDKNIIEEPKAKYIAYKSGTNFVDVTILSNSLKIFLNVKSGELKDSYNLARDLTKPKPVGHWGNGDYEVKVDKNTNLDNLCELIQQSYNYNL
ncbi:MAG TPA: DUF5655 domain-containing protein [Candidatus Paceibacterota bacterium]